MNPIPLPVGLIRVSDFKAMIGPPDEHGCRLWMASCFKNSGYGQFSVDGKLKTAHRVAWAIVHGDPGQLDVLHTCDNPRCVAIDHLFSGTHTDNMKDMVSKGRNKTQFGTPEFYKTRKQSGEYHWSKKHPESFARVVENFAHNKNKPRGEKQHLAKLTEEQVREIRALSKQGITGTRLARRFKISPGGISCIVNLKTWAHVL